MVPEVFVVIAPHSFRCVSSGFQLRDRVRGQARCANSESTSPNGSTGSSDSIGSAGRRRSNSSAARIDPRRAAASRTRTRSASPSGATARTRAASKASANEPAASSSPCSPRSTQRRTVFGVTPTRSLASSIETPASMRPSSRARRSAVNRLAAMTTPPRFPTRFFFAANLRAVAVAVRLGVPPPPPGGAVALGAAGRWAEARLGAGAGAGADGAERLGVVVDVAAGDAERLGELGGGQEAGGRDGRRVAVGSSCGLLKSFGEWACGRSACGTARSSRRAAGGSSASGFEPCGDVGPGEAR